MGFCEEAHERGGLVKAIGAPLALLQMLHSLSRLQRVYQGAACVSAFVCLFAFASP